MMTAGRDAILVIIEPVHERFDGDGKNIRGADEFAPRPESNAVNQAALVRAYDRTQFIRVEQGAIGDPIHRLIEVNMAGDVGRHAKALNEKRDPTAVGMTAWDRFEVAHVCASANLAGHRFDAV